MMMLSSSKYCSVIASSKSLEECLWGSGIDGSSIMEFFDIVVQKVERSRNERALNVMFT